MQFRQINYQKLDNTFEFDKIIKKENCSKSNLMYNANHIFTNITVIVNNLITFL